jgi:hypothetical protein
MHTDMRFAPRNALEMPPCDLAISAVASDDGFVTELITDIAQRLRMPPAWRRDATPQTADAEVSVESSIDGMGDSAGEAINEVPSLPTLALADSRVILLLHQHLWYHDDQMRSDELVLRQRVSERPGSVCVIALDDVPLPKWLARAPHYDVKTGGRVGAADFVLGVVAAAGGAVAPKPVASEDVARPRWPEAPAPFLAQPRAHSALRHQLDTLGEELETVIDRCKAAQPDRIFELLTLPNRLVARLDDVAVSFSWLTGGSTSIAEGRLLVIAWRNVASGVKGPAALKPAAMMYERSYAADGGTPDAWRWRAEDGVRQAYSSANLAEAWLARIAIARGA